MLLAALSQTVVASHNGAHRRRPGRIRPLHVAFNLVPGGRHGGVSLVGRLSDIYGCRVFLIAGIATFIVGSALVGFSASMNQVVGFRVVQGIGGGMVMTCCYVSIADLFAPRGQGQVPWRAGRRVRAGDGGGAGSWARSSQRVSPGAGHSCSSALAGVPILALTARIYPRSNPPSERRDLDYPGMATLVLAVAPVAVALSSVGVLYSWNAPQSIGLMAFGLAMAALFVALESRARFPIMPLRVYRQRALAVSIIVTLLTSVSLHGFTLFLPLYFRWRWELPQHGPAHC